MSQPVVAREEQRYADIFVGDSEMARLMRSHDWAATPLGPPEHWPDALKVALRILLTSRFAMWLGWGPDVHFFYNDAYRPTLGLKHPQSLGQPTRLLWAEIWDDVRGRIRAVYEEGASTWDEALLLLLERGGYREETYHTFSYSPLIGDGGRVEGLFCTVSEETERVVGERRLATLRELARGLAAAHARPKVLEATAAALANATRDLTFSALYLFDNAGVARLATSAGVPAGSLLAPAEADAAGLWQPRRVAAGEGPFAIPLGADLPVPLGAWDAPARQALVVPVPRKGGTPAGFLVCGLNPYRPLDADCIDFLDLVAGQIGAGIAGAEAFERRTAERDRLRALFQQSPSFICVLRGPEHVFELANQSYIKLVGKRELEGKAVRDAFPEVTGQGFFELLDQVFRTGEPYVGQGLQIDLEREPGAGPVRRYIDFVYQPITDASGARSGIFVVGHDVTDATLATRELQRTQEWLEEGLEAGRMVAVEWDLASRRVKYSGNAPEVLGHGDAVEDVGWSAVHPDDRAGLRAALDEGVRSGRTFRHLVRRTRADNGRQMWTDVRGRFTRGQEGRPVSMRGIVIDVTERIEAERALLDASRRKDEFLAMLAHELRNPLAPIRNGRADPAHAGDR